MRALGHGDADACRRIGRAGPLKIGCGMCRRVCDCTGFLSGFSLKLLLCGCHGVLRARKSLACPVQIHNHIYVFPHYASDGQSGGNVPFTEAILDSEHGGFAEGIAFQPAIPRVSNRLKQRMLIKKDILTHAIPDAISEHFCIRPALVPDTYYHGTFGIHAVQMISRSVSITSRRTSTNMPMIGNETAATAFESVQTQAQDEAPDLAFKRKLNDIVGEQATKG